MKKKIFNDVLDDFVEIEFPPKRIVSLDPAATETLFLIGAGGLVVGTDAFSYRPPEAKNLLKLGSYTHVKYELLEKLKPEIIFTTQGAQKRLTSELIDKGYPVYSLRVATSIGEILNNILIVGNAVGYQLASRQLHSELLKIINKIPTPQLRPSVYIELDLGGPISPGFPTHISDGVWLAGGRNIFDNLVEAYVEPDPKSVKEAEPDIVIYEPKRESPDELQRFIRSLERRGLTELLSATIYVTKGDFLAHQGPSFITESLTWLNKTISSWIQSKK